MKPILLKKGEKVISELNKIELDLKPLLDAQKRDKKIDGLLD